MQVLIKVSHWLQFFCICIFVEFFVVVMVLGCQIFESVMEKLQVLHY